MEFERVATCGNKIILMTDGVYTGEDPPEQRTPMGSSRRSRIQAQTKAT